MVVATYPVSGSLPNFRNTMYPAELQISRVDGFDCFDCLLSTPEPSLKAADSPPESLESLATLAKPSESYDTGKVNFDVDGETQLDEYNASVGSGTVATTHLLTVAECHCHNLPRRQSTPLGLCSTNSRRFGIQRSRKSNTTGRKLQR